MPYIPHHPPRRPGIDSFEIYSIPFGKILVYDYPELMAPSFNYWMAVKKDFRGYRLLNELSIDQVSEGAGIPVHEVVAFDMGAEPSAASRLRLRRFMIRRDMDAFSAAIEEEKKKNNKALRRTTFKIWVVLAVTIWAVLKLWGSCNG